MSNDSSQPAATSRKAPLYFESVTSVDKPFPTRLDGAWPARATEQLKVAARLLLGKACPGNEEAPCPVSFSVEHMHCANQADPIKLAVIFLGRRRPGFDMEW